MTDSRGAGAPDVRGRRRPDRPAVLGSAGIHVGIALIVVLVSALRPPPVQYETVMIEIVSPPPAPAEEAPEDASLPEELEVDTPEPEPEEAEIPLPTEEETPPPTPDQPPVEDTPETAEEEAPPVEEDLVEEPEEEVGSGLNVRLEGLMRDYPEYWERIITQIGRCFRGSQNAHSAVVRFTIHNDGTVSDIDVVESSGSLAFELSAIEAVECAGRGRFGPLPSDFQYETLPVLFSFQPRG